VAIFRCGERFINNYKSKKKERQRKMKIKEKELCWENSVYYMRVKYLSDKPPKFFKIYLYNWSSPNAEHTGIDHVYTADYSDFQRLLTHWNLADWTYTELE
jgi:hypothetical protein